MWCVEEVNAVRELMCAFQSLDTCHNQDRLNNLIQWLKGIRLWRKLKEVLNSENILPIIKYGGGHVMVSGCVSSKGVRSLVFID